jgi:hypothetical protein
LRAREDEITGAGAALAAVGLGDRAYGSRFRAETGIDFPLLVDEERRAYRAAGLKSGSLLHVLRRDNVRARARARGAGHRQRRLGRDPFQLGASFVFAPGDRDLYVHLSETFGDNAPVAELVAAVSAYGEGGGQNSTLS